AYVFFWFWIVFVLVVQFFTALHATILYMIPTWTHRELCSILQLGERDPKRRVVHIFLKEHLHLEGFIASYTEGKLERSDCIRNGEAIVDNF
uniref:Innexin n=1 Tax=Acrobeloides nanus TaxID=290746 RepID=A0A914CU34_9BILA